MWRTCTVKWGSKWVYCILSINCFRVIVQHYSTIGWTCRVCRDNRFAPPPPIYCRLQIEQHLPYSMYNIYIVLVQLFVSILWRTSVTQSSDYPVWLDRLTHLLREAQSHCPPFCLHGQLCKHDTRAAYKKSRVPRNWDEYVKCLWKLWSYRNYYI